MQNRNFRKLLEARWSGDRFVCVGLDSNLGNIPGHIQQRDNKGTIAIAATITAFNREIVCATKDLVCAYKINSAFYERHGTEGCTALKNTIRDIHEIAPDVPVILDAKRADISTTNNEYAHAAFDYLDADAITVHPYLGKEALQPFLKRKDKGVIVLCRTSNPGATEFQNLSVNGRELYEIVADHVTKTWNKNGNCAVVVGATYPQELRNIREIVNTMPILIPGVGAQGGDVKAVVSAGKDSDGRGMIINSSRGIIFASSGTDFAEAALYRTQHLHDLINRYR